MGLHVNRVQGDTNEFQDMGRPEGFFRGNRDVQFLKQGKDQHRAVAQREQGACWAMKKSSKI